MKSFVLKISLGGLFEFRVRPNSPIKMFFFLFMLFVRNLGSSCDVLDAIVR